jgi:hypothetical protein
MNTFKKIGMTTALLGVAFAGSAFAADTQKDFPTERTQPVSCDQVKWNADMLLDHPALVEACQEVVVVDGESWARFEAKFVKIDPDGQVHFSVRDKRDRSIEEVEITPTPGQVAYIDGQETPFRRLRSTQRVNLYVPEGEYGFATQPGAPRTQLASMAPAKPVMVAQRDRLPAVLPQTAGPLPWIALGGLLSLLGGLGMTLRRKF